MNAVFGSADRRPTNDLASNELVGRDSVKPVGNDVSTRNFAISDTSEIARRRLLSLRGEPLFYANWDNAIFIHYETGPQELRGCIPYDLDLYDGRAFVSLVAFTMRGMRPRFGGRIGELLLRPIATHNFLNVRTYVRHKGEPGIYFMREWLSSRLAAGLGPWSFGLPYRFGRIYYESSSRIRDQVILSGVKWSRRIPRPYLNASIPGWKAWPRRLRCSLDFARNDGSKARNYGLGGQR